jgi:hypothetical protein
MTWQLNEINALIWPSPNISTTYQVLKSKPADAAFRTDLAKKASDTLNRKEQISMARVSRRPACR